jgi:hypothetical protein
MDIVSGKLQVFFEDPFWVGIFEQVSCGKLTVCKVTFGAEPKDNEVLKFILCHYDKLKFSPPVDGVKSPKEKINPKRLQREVKKQINDAGIGTKSQQALKLQQEQGKTERKERIKEKRETEKRLHFELKQQKRKEKHKGR